jgi:ribosome production factor 1
MPLTIDDQKEIDENFVFDAEENQELIDEEDQDEFAEYFNEKY